MVLGVRGMRANVPVRIAIAAVWALLLGAAAPVRAQEEGEAPAEAEAGQEVYVGYEAWIAQPTGLQYTPATIHDSPDGSYSSRTLVVPHDTDYTGRFRVGYTLPQGWGTVLFTYFSAVDEQAVNQRRPGEYVFGEVLAFQPYAGFSNDGLADSYTAETTTRMRDFRLEYSRPAFRTPRVSGDWSLGWRRVTHSRSLEALYRALLPDLPSLVPPNVCGSSQECPLLTPQPDTASSSSSYTGRGLTGGLDVKFDVYRNKLFIESGASLAALRGKIDSNYASNTRYYVAGASPTNPGLILNPPYDDFFFFADQITESTLPIALTSQSTSTSSFILDVYAGFRWRALSWLEVFGGFRDTRYDDVGIDLRPRIATLSLDSFGVVILGFEDMEEVHRSATYEGFYGGIGIRLK